MRYCPIFSNHNGTRNTTKCKKTKLSVSFVVAVVPSWFNFALNFLLVRALPAKIRQKLIRWQASQIASQVSVFDKASRIFGANNWKKTLAT